MDALFSEQFPFPDPSAWPTQVQKELKDENAYESLRWQTDEGFIMEPYYPVSTLRRPGSAKAGSGLAEYAGIYRSE